MNKYLAVLAFCAAHLGAQAADLPSPQEPQRSPLQQAAEQGQAEAQEALALQLIPQDGNPGNPEQSVYWFRKAAEQGRARSQYYLGTVLLAQGDKTEARQWLQKSAQQKYPAAQALLKRLHDTTRDGVLK
jgi:TPR repeat protein